MVDWHGRIFKVVGLTLIAVVAHCAVLAVVADAARRFVSGRPLGIVEVATRRVPIAATRPTLVCAITKSGTPRRVHVKVLAMLAIEAVGVMTALALAVHLRASEVERLLERHDLYFHRQSPHMLASVS